MVFGSPPTPLGSCRRNDARSRVMLHFPTMLRLALLLALLPPLAFADVTGPARVIDGDTIEVAGERIRLLGVAAPKMDVPDGSIAAMMMRHIVAGQRVRCRDTGERAGGRIAAVCHLENGEDIGELFVRLGHARDCRRYSDGRNAEAEPAAVAEGRNLSKTYPLPRYRTP